MADTINIRNLEIFAYHGVLEEEKKTGQNFYVNVEMETSTREAGRSDNLSKTVNYALVCERIKEVMTEKSYDLIETCAEKVAEMILLEFEVDAATVEIRKPSAPIPMEFEDVSVKIRREFHSAVVAFGANLGDAKQTVIDAMEDVSKLPCVKSIAESSIIETEPYGVTDQPRFYNSVAEIKTLYTPSELLDVLHRLENEAGRVRELRWGPRTLDLDIILYDDLVLQDDPALCIPHIDMQNRDFVLEPLNEILPYRVHPLTGKRVCEMLAELRDKESGRKNDAEMIFV